MEYKYFKEFHIGSHLQILSFWREQRYTASQERTPEWRLSFLIILCTYPTRQVLFPYTHSKKCCTHINWDFNWWKMINPGEGCRDFLTTSFWYLLTLSNFSKMQAIDPWDFTDWAGSIENHCKTDWTPRPAKTCANTRSIRNSTPAVTKTDYPSSTLQW